MITRNPGWGLVKKHVVMFRYLAGMRRQVYMYNIFKHCVNVPGVPVGIWNQ